MPDISSLSTGAARVAVVGSGAVGAYYGGMLARSGCDVTFLMRSDLRAASERGLVIHTGGERLQFPVKMAATPQEIGPVDLVLIGLKTTANSAMEELLPPLLGPETSLLTLQNGLGNEEYLASRWGADRVLGALCYVCLNRVAPAEIVHTERGSISLGEWRPRDGGQRAQFIARALMEAGVHAEVVPDLVLERWRKLVWNIPFNGLSIAAGGATVADVLNDSGLRAEALALMREVIAVAASIGLHIPESFADDQIQRSWRIGPYRTSSLVDWELGRAVEVEAIWGEPLRRANTVGVHCPRLELLYALLKKLAGAF